MMERSCTFLSLVNFPEIVINKSSENVQPILVFNSLETQFATGIEQSKIMRVNQIQARTGSAGYREIPGGPVGWWAGGPVGRYNWLASDQQTTIMI